MPSSSGWQRWRGGEVSGTYLACFVVGKYGHWQKQWSTQSVVCGDSSRHNVAVVGRNDPFRRVVQVSRVNSAQSHFCPFPYLAILSKITARWSFDPNINPPYISNQTSQWVISNTHENVIQFLIFSKNLSLNWIREDLHVTSSLSCFGLPLHFSACRSSRHAWSTYGSIQLASIGNYIFHYDQHVWST